MYHSITFTRGEVVRNTWTNWHLIPTSRPVIAPPKLKEKYLSVPGRSRILDFSEVVKLFPTYKNREGEIEFIVDNGHGTRMDILDDLTSFLNGQVVTAVLEDDLANYYEGRFFVKKRVCEAHWTKVTLSYILKPYKFRITSSLEDWKWDPFNFETGVIQKDVFYGIEVDSSETRVLTITGLIGRMPVCPTFDVTLRGGTTSLGLRVQNPELGLDYQRMLPNGRTKDENIIFTDISAQNVITLRFSGEATVSVDFRSGGF